MRLLRVLILSLGGRVLVLRLLDALTKVIRDDDPFFFISLLLMKYEALGSVIFIFFFSPLVG